VIPQISDFVNSLPAKR